MFYIYIPILNTLTEIGMGRILKNVYKKVISAQMPFDVSLDPDSDLALRAVRLHSSQV